MPSDLIQKRLGQLARLSGELEKENDSINHLLESFQEQLRQLGLDAPVYVYVGGPGPRWQLGFDQAPEWCLVYRSRLEGEARPGDPVPLVRAERDLRILALPLLPKLLGAVKDDTETTLDKVRTAKARLKEELDKI